MARRRERLLAEARSRLVEVASPLLVLSQACEEPMRVEYAVRWSVVEPLSQSKKLQPEAAWKPFARCPSRSVATLLPAEWRCAAEPQLCSELVARDASFQPAEWLICQVDTDRLLAHGTCRTTHKKTALTWAMATVGALRRAAPTAV